MTKRNREALGVDGYVYSLDSVMVSQVHICVKVYQIVHLKYVLYCMSIILQ